MANYSGRFRAPKQTDNPFKIGYDPELDVSQELEPDAALGFQSVSGILRWITKHESIDIMTKVSLLLSH